METFVNDENAMQDIDISSRQGESHKYHLEEFDGPIDLLLFLIRKNEVNIYDIPIATITEQYLSYVKYATRVSLEDSTEFYVMAATLLYIKSRMLLPVDMDLEDEIEDPRKDLVERLIEYQKYRKLTSLMQEREEQAEWYLERKKIQTTLEFEPDENLWEQIEVWDLLKTFSKIMNNLSAERIISLYEEVSVNEKIALIMEFLETKGEFSFEDLIIRKGSLMDVVCAFLAILECVKSRMILIMQNKLFGDIRIRPRPHELHVASEIEGGDDYYES